MSQNFPNATAGQLFATERAPYLAYLRALGDGWEEVNLLRMFLFDAANALRDLSVYPVRRQGIAQPNLDRIFASIIDLRADNAGRTNNIAIAAQISKSQIQGQHEGTVNAGVADNFFRILRECASDVHTRLIILQDSVLSTTQDDRYIEALFFGHVLGVELNLTPMYVCSLSQRGERKELPRMRLYQNPIFMDSHVKFPMSYGQSDNVGAYLGRAKFGNGMPHIVVVSLQALKYSQAEEPSTRKSNAFAEFLKDFFESPDRKAEATPPHTTQHEACAGKLWEPPSPIDWSRRPAPFPHPPVNPEPLIYFEQAVRSSLLSTDPLDASIPTGSWLSALIRMQVISCAGALDHIIKTSNYNDPERAEQLSAMCSSLDSTMSQIVRLREYVTGMRQSDYAASLHELQRLVHEVGVHKKETNELLIARFRVKSNESAELTVRESQSAIALTILAFFFIPVNLASSIFGMNVQEINQTGHSIWTFVVASIVLLTISWLGWRLRRPLHEFTELAMLIFQDILRWPARILVLTVFFTVLAPLTLLVEGFRWARFEIRHLDRRWARLWRRRV